VTYDPPFPGAFDGAAGGGISTVFSEPWYQRGIVPAGLANRFRGAPDIAADADNYTGLLTAFTDPDTGEFVEEPVGGTSLAAPIVATEMALVQARTGCAIGFANPLLYGLARAHSKALIDVQHQKIDVVNTYDDALTVVDFGDHNTSLKTTPGWDDVTGLGTFSVAGLSAAIRR
jgi:subtilase family serine protease